MFKFQRSKIAKRSPLKSPPLRMPGQSVQEEIDRIVDRFTDHAALLGLACFAALMEWFRYFFNSPPQPLILSILAGLVAVFVVMKGMKARLKLRQLKQARDGEKVIGQSLERLREKGYRVVHDIVGNGFNIDHVLIGPPVFTQLRPRPSANRQKDAVRSLTTAKRSISMDSCRTVIRLSRQRPRLVGLRVF